MSPRELTFKAFSSAYEYLPEQYPHQSSNGRRELRAMDRDSTGSNSTRASASRSRDRSKVNSIDTTIHVPTSQAGEELADSQGEDFSKRYASRRAVTQSESTIQRSPMMNSPMSDLPNSPDYLEEMDDAVGQPVPIGEMSKQRGVSVPNRTRYF